MNFPRPPRASLSVVTLGLWFVAASTLTASSLSAQVAARKYNAELVKTADVAASIACYNAQLVEGLLPELDKRIPQSPSVAYASYMPGFAVVFGSKLDDFARAQTEFQLTEPPAQFRKHEKAMDEALTRLAQLLKEGAAEASEARTIADGARVRAGLPSRIESIRNVLASYETARAHIVQAAGKGAQEGFEPGCPPVQRDAAQ